MTITEPGFRGRCTLPDLVPVQDLTDEQEAARPKGECAIKHQGQWCAVVPHVFETENAALFEAHMADHGKRALTSRRNIRASWRPPRLSEGGKPFEPTGLEPGATITWTQLVPSGETETGRRYDYAQRRDIFFEVDVCRPVERSGQVWSAAYRPKSAWVRPLDPFPGEYAVLVQQLRGVVVAIADESRYAKGHRPPTYVRAKAGAAS